MNTLLLLYYDITGSREKVMGKTNACAIDKRRHLFRPSSILFFRHFTKSDSKEHVTLVPPNLKHHLIPGFPVADFILEF